MRRPLTFDQAAVVEALMAAVPIGAEIAPLTLFPRRTRNGRPLRRSLRRMAEGGLLEPGDAPGTVRLTRAAVEAYDRWFEARGRRSPGDGYGQAARRWFET